MNIRWSHEALTDLRNLHSYIATESPTAAQKVVMTIMNTVEVNLSNNPHIGRPGRVNGTRELVIANTPYVVPYRIKFGVLQILRVYHEARRWPEQL